MTQSGHWRREPLMTFQHLQNELSRWLEDCLQAGNRGSAAAQSPDSESSSWSPPVDVIETPEETIIVAELPGVDPTKVDLSISGKLLVLRGVKERENTPESQLRMSERRLGAFHRQIVLSEDVDFDAAQADARHGVLTIRLPRQKTAKPRTIPIRPN